MRRPDAGLHVVTKCYEDLDQCLMELLFEVPVGVHKVVRDDFVAPSVGSVMEV